MSHLSADDIPGYFERYGWMFEPSEVDGLFRTGFLGDTGHYDIWLRLTDQWVYFAISPFFEPPTEHDGADLMRVILEANHEVKLAKLMIDDDGDVAMHIELPREGFAYSHFADALTAMSHYADDLRPRFDELEPVSGGEVV